TDSAKPDAVEPKVAETEPAPLQQPSGTEPAPAANAAASKIATLGGAPVAIEDASPKTNESEKAERKARAREQAREDARAEARAKARRRHAARARLARQRQATQQLPLGLFGDQRQTPAAQN